MAIKQFPVNRTQSRSFDDNLEVVSTNDSKLHTVTSYVAEMTAS